VQSSSQTVTSNKPTSSFLQAGCPSCHCQSQSTEGKMNSILLYVAVVLLGKVGIIEDLHICSCCKCICENLFPINIVNYILTGKGFSQIHLQQLQRRRKVFKYTNLSMQYISAMSYINVVT